MLLTWCGWHVQVYAIFWKCWHEHVMKHLVTMAEQKGCHGGETKMVPWQHIRKWCHGNISVPVAHGDTGAKGGVRMCATCKMVGCSRIPGSHGTAAWQTRNVQRPLSDTVQTRASHTTCMHSFIAIVPSVIPSKRVFGGGRVQSGSSCTRRR